MFLLTTCGLQISTSLLSIACDDVWEILGVGGIQSIINIAKNDLSDSCLCLLCQCLMCQFQ